MAKNILLQKDSTYKINENINLILSPEFYSVRIFTIPIESNKELKLVIPNFFEEYFDINNYNFYHIKLEKHKYLCFAYKQDEILESMKSSSIDLKFIKNIYFLQNELKNKSNELYSYDKSKYICSDSLIVKVPSNFQISKESKTIDIQNITLSKHNIFLNKSSKYIDNKTAYIISCIFVLFAFFNFYKITIENSQIKKYEEKLELLKNRYHVPSSMIQTKSIINEYKEVKDKYLNFLSALEYILKYKKANNTLLKDIEYKNNKIYLSFENKNKKTIEDYIKKRYKILSSRAYNNKLNIEVKL